ncbi:MAG: efflux RND transporter periplasmic adaptor subunit [Elusimicrobia bacterium]|nr:efflux RND transporter periplasmic adaptor subunit [Elusimicrobiota bacterium]
MEVRRLITRRRVLLAALALVLAGGGWWAYKRHKKSGAKPEAAADTAKVSKGDLELHFTDSGELAPKNYVDVASKVSGRITEFMVQEGQRVAKGDRIAVVQPGRTEAERYLPFTVTAPIGGIVMRYQKQGSYQEESRIVRLGDYVTGLIDSVTPTYLLTIADLSTLIVKMKISEMDILKLKPGMAVDVTVDALPGTKIPSRVTLVSPQADKDNNNLKTFKVEVTLGKADPRLKPGMTARVDGLLEARKNVLKIPLAAVFEEMGSEYAYTKPQSKKGKPGHVKLKLGLRNETDVEVVDGLKEGDELLTEKPPAEEKKA